MELTPATLDDVDAVLALFQRYDEVEIGSSDMDPEDIELQLRTPDAVTVLARTDGALWGYAHLAPTGDLETATDPVDSAFRAQQERLLDWAVIEATAREIPILHHWTGARPDGAGALLADRGFLHVRTSWGMRRPLGEPVEPPVWPTGVEVRPFLPDRHAEALWALVQLGFAGTYGSRRRTLAEWTRVFLGPGTDAVCAWSGSDLVGAAVLSLREATGFVPQVVVHPEHRGRGIALAVLREAFGRFAAQGRDTTLSVDGTNDRAARLYRTAGMHADVTYHHWERES